MAKRGRKRGGLDRTAVGIGTALGNVVNRIENWRRQRDEIAAEVRQVVAAGTQLLSELGHDANVRLASMAGPLLKRKGGRPKGYKMSAATRRKLKAAWRRRKAAAGTTSSAARPARRRKSNLSPEARARIAAAQKKRWAAYRAAKKS